MVPAAHELPSLERLIVTRPLAEAERWTGALVAQGWPAQVLPLIQIGPPVVEADLQALSDARMRWAEWDALMFVSSAAVKWFFDGLCPQVEGENRTRFWAPGPGTARALLPVLQSLGLPADRIDSPPEDARQFDSEALWPVVRNQLAADKAKAKEEGRRILVVRGTTADVPDGSLVSAHPGQGRDWLIRQCESLGAEVQTCVAYTRQAPSWSKPMRDLALTAARPGSVWLLSSSESLVHLKAALPATNWASATALVTHPRIALAAREFGFGEVFESRPALPDVLWALKSRWSPI